MIHKIRLAERTLHVETTGDWLQARLRSCTPIDGLPTDGGRPAGSEPHPVGRGKFFLGGRDRAIASGGKDHRHVRVVVEGLGEVNVYGEKWVSFRPLAGAEVTPALAGETILGPGVSLALAASGVWSLHASGIATPRGVYAFLGASGAGKSTLARGLQATGCGARIADDILLVERGVEATFEAHPDHPQLKLSPQQQPWRRGVPKGPVAALFVLRGGVDGPSRPHLEALNAVAAARAVIESTVATRVFPPDLLAENLEFSAALAGSVPVARLEYRWEDGFSEKVAEVLGL